MSVKDESKMVAAPELLNAIRNEATTAYREMVPEATAYNLQDVGNPILNYDTVANEFLNALVNKIVMTLVERKLWSNPLGILKTGEMPLGMDIEDTHVNPAIAENYDVNEPGMADILKMHKPDVAAVWYRLNRQDKYPVTIANDVMRQAFTSWGKLEDMIAALVDTLYNGNTIDEFKYTKQLVADAIAAGKIQTRPTVMPINDQTGKQFMQDIRTLSMLFTFPSTNFNNYKFSGGAGPARISFSSIADQIILIRADVASAVGVQVLSSVFNVDYADYSTRQIVVDDFGNPSTLAVLCDKKAFVIFQQLRQFATFFNASSLSWQYYYHAWDLFALSPFKNCVAFVTA